jgi:hypothetical protein
MAVINKYDPLEDIYQSMVSKKDNIPNTDVNTNNIIGNDADKFTQSNKNEFENHSYLKQDNRTSKQREVSQKYAKSMTDPSIGQQLIEGLQLPLRYTANPLKLAGDVAATVAPNSPIAKTLPNTIKDRQDLRKIQLNPAVSDAEKTNSLINTTRDLGINSLINAGTAELGFAAAPGATGNLLGLFKAGSKANFAADLLQLSKVDLNRVSKGDRNEIGTAVLNLLSSASKMDNFDASTIVSNIKNWNRISNSDKLDTYKDIYNLSQSLNQQNQRQ